MTDGPDPAEHGADDTIVGLAEEERATLVRAEHAARADADAARRRLGIVATASSALATTFDTDELLQRLTRVLAPAVGDWCVVELVDERGLSTHVAVRATDRACADAAVDALRRHPVDLESDDPVARVLRSRQPRLFADVESAQRATRAAQRAPELAGVYGDADVRSSLIVPIEARGKVRGTLSLVTTERVLDDDDLDVALDVAHRVALALDNIEAFTFERNLAETLQRALLPTIEDVPGLDVAVRYLAATDGAEIGGDWYDVIPIGPDRVDVVIGDVVGHDLAAATTMSQLRNVLRAYACLDGATPHETLERLDQLMNRLGTESASCVLAAIDLASSRVGISNAGHPGPVLVSDGKAVLLQDPHDWLVGVPTTDRTRSTAWYDLPPGAALVLYTDGAVERRDLDLDVRMELLRRTVQSTSEDPAYDAESLCDALVAAMLPSTMARHDDVAILVVRRTEGGPGA